MRSVIGSLTLSAALAALSMSGSQACADTLHIQELRAITDAAKAAVETRGRGVEAQADIPDPRLRLAACENPLEAALPPAVKGPRLSVRVSCSGAARWSVLVPVRVETTATLVVARRALLPGTLISPDDIKTEARRIAGFADCCAADPAALLGQKVRRPVPADAPVPLDSVEAAPLVRRGQIVTVVAGAPGFEVRSSGIAMADAKEGDPVRVRHSTSLRVIQARADSKGVVRADR
jgi:flagella basal body P-ring formation protein FlgA